MSHGSSNGRQSCALHGSGNFSRVALLFGHDSGVYLAKSCGEASDAGYIEGRLHTVQNPQELFESLGATQYVDLCKKFGEVLRRFGQEHFFKNTGGEFRQ